MFVLALFLMGLTVFFFINLGKIFAWLFYDTNIEAQCDGFYVPTSAKAINPKSCFSYSYADKGYSVSLIVPFAKPYEKYRIKIRSDKPWKAVSMYEFILGIILCLILLPMIVFLYTGVIFM